MRRTSIFRSAAAAAAFLHCAGALAQQPALPGAVGFGINTPAGRGGDIYRVTNLNDSGEGSLRACVEAAGPRYCLFEVSGVIRLGRDLEVTSPNLTIAGQTAPAPGIMLRAAGLRIQASDVLVQHLALRPGDDPDGSVTHARDGLRVTGDTRSRNIVIDHCSITWAIDENVSSYGNWDNVTISNSIIAEPLRDSISSSGPEGRGALLGADMNNSHISLIGNLFAHSWGRNPRSDVSHFVMVNNVVYNPGETAVMLSNVHGFTSDNSIVGNVFIDGANTNTKPIRLIGPTAVAEGAELIAGTKIYLADNVAPGVSGDQWAMIYNKSDLTRGELEASSAPVWVDGLEAIETGSGAVLDSVLQNAGVRPAQRADADARIVASVANGTGRVINCVADDGTSRCSKNAGGWPRLAKNTRQLEIPADPHADGDGDGYTNIEEWLHMLAAEAEGREWGEPDPGLPPKPPVLQN